MANIIDQLNAQIAAKTAALVDAQHKLAVLKAFQPLMNNSTEGVVTALNNQLDGAGLDVSYIRSHPNEVPGMIAAFQHLVDTIPGEIDGLNQAKKDAEAAANKLIAQGLSPDEAYAQVHAKTVANATARNVLVWTGVVVLVAIVIYFGVKLIKRAKKG